MSLGYRPFKRLHRETDILMQNMHDPTPENESEIEFLEKHGYRPRPSSSHSQIIKECVDSINEFLANASYIKIPRRIYPDQIILLSRKNFTDYCKIAFPKSKVERLDGVYNPELDIIIIPNDHNEVNFRSTIFHEAAHALSFKSTNNSNNDFARCGFCNYRSREEESGFDEVMTELTSMFMMHRKDSDALKNISAGLLSYIETIRVTLCTIRKICEERVLSKIKSKKIKLAKVKEAIETQMGITLFKLHKAFINGGGAASILKKPLEKIKKGAFEKLNSIKHGLKPALEFARFIGLPQKDIEYIQSNRPVDLSMLEVWDLKHAHNPDRKKHESGEFLIKVA